MRIKEKLLSMKETIDTIKSDRSKLEGKLEAVMQQLKDDFNVTTLKAAEKKYEALKKEEDELTEDLEKRIEKLENDYEWN